MVILGGWMFLMGIPLQDLTESEDTEALMRVDTRNCVHACQGVRFVEVQGFSVCQGREQD